MQGTKLRFGSFSDRWTSTTIGQILTIKHGKDYKHLPEGDIPVLGTGGKISGVTEALCNWPCVLIGRKGTINKPQYMDVPFWSVDTLFYSKAKDGQSPKFQYYLFQTIDWLKYNEASGVPSLSAATIENIAVNVPSLDEQKKIASFFSTLDERIALEEKKLGCLEKIKKSFIRQLLSEKLRFSPGNGQSYPDWENKKISDIATVCGGGTPSTAKDTYWGGPIQWLTPTEIDTKYVHKSIRTITKLGLDNSSAKLLPQGSLLLTTRATIGACSINNFKGSVCTNQGFQSLICNDKVLPEYMYYVVISGKFQKEMTRLASGSTFLELSSKNLKSIEIKLPSIAEQERIANFLSLIDEKIDINKQVIKKLEKAKFGFLQNMFI